MEPCPVEGALMELGEVEMYTINGERLGRTMSDWMLAYGTDFDDLSKADLRQIGDDEEGDPLEFREKRMLGKEKRYVLPGGLVNLCYTPQGTSSELVRPAGTSLTLLRRPLVSKNFKSLTVHSLEEYLPSLMYLKIIWI